MTLKFVSVLLLISALATAANAETAVCVVASLSGTATLESKGTPSARRVELFDWIPAGYTLTVPRASILVVVFANGVRFEMRDGAMATVSMQGLTNTSGSIRELSRVPVFPILPPIEDKEKKATTAGAPRLLRNDFIRGLYPRNGARTLPNNTVLRFSPINEAVDYSILLEDDRGTSLLDIRTPFPSVQVPAGVLRSHEHYVWRVKANVRIGPSKSNEADFSTLASEEIERRVAWQLIAVNSDDYELILLAAELDRQLGLLLEAREQLMNASNRWPDDNGIRQQLSKVSGQLSED